MYKKIVHFKACFLNISKTKYLKKIWPFSIFEECLKLLSTKFDPFKILLDQATLMTGVSTVLWFHVFSFCPLKYSATISSLSLMFLFEYLN